MLTFILLSSDGLLSVYLHLLIVWNICTFLRSHNFILMHDVVAVFIVVVVDVVVVVAVVVVGVVVAFIIVVIMRDGSIYLSNRLFMGNLQ